MRIIKPKNEKEFNDTFDDKKIIDVGAGGDCLFKAIAYAEIGNANFHKELRSACVDYMKTKKDTFSPFIGTFIDPDINEGAKRQLENLRDKSTGHIPFDAYIQIMSNPGSWGGFTEIIACQDILQRRIEVWHYTNNTYTQYKSVTVDGFEKNNPIQLLYVGNSHYQCIVSKKAVEEKAAEEKTAEEKAAEIKERIETLKNNDNIKKKLDELKTTYGTKPANKPANKPDNKPANKPANKINVKQLKIMIETNYEKEPFPLTFSKIHNPIASRVPENVKMSEYPYFTGDVPYPESVLKKKEYSELLRVFFDKNEFVDVIVKPAQKNGGDAADNKPNANTINKNIMIMLNLIFPTSYPSYDNIESSYNKYLKKTPSEMNFDFSIDKVVNAISTSENLNEDLKREYSYLKLTNGTYTVSEIVWLNDVLNEPVYRELVDKLIEYDEWAEERKETLQTDIDKSIKVLTDGLQNDGVDTKEKDESKKVEDESKKAKQIESSFRITEEELTRLKKQMQIFTKENLETEMKTIFDKFFTISTGKEAEYQKYKTIVFDNFSKKFNRITQEREFKQEFDFSIKDIPKKETETDDFTDFFQLHEAYDNKKENDAKMKEIQQKIRDFNIDINDDDDITKIIDKLDKLLKILDKYNDETKILHEDEKNKFDELKNRKDREKKDELKRLNETINSMLKEKIEIEITDKKIIKNIYTRDDISRMETVVGKVKEFIQKLSDLKSELIKLLKSNPVFRMNMITLVDSSTNFNEKAEAIIDEINANQPKLIVSTIDKLDKQQTLAEIKKALGTNIELLQHLLYKSFEKYLKSLPFTRSDRLMFEKKEIDDNIEKMTKDIHALNKLHDSGKKTIGDIINLTESIQNFFNKIRKSGQISGLSTMELKIARIMKLANEIKAFKLIQDNVLSNDNKKGLFVYYEKEFAGDENTKRLFFDELRKEKYSVFTNTVAYIQKTFLQNNRQSMNAKLQKIMNQYFQNTSDDFHKQIIHPADELINEGTQPTFDEYWNVSVTSKKTSNESKEPEYEIFVYMEVIKGELNPANKGMVKCNYLDEQLTLAFDRLTSMRNQFEILRKKPFSIEETIENQKKEAAENIKEVEEAKAKISAAAASAAKKLPEAAPVMNPNENPFQLPMANAVAVGGKKRRNTRRRYKRKNYYYTVRKH